MAHIGKQIADAIVAALDGATEAGSRVSHRRFWPLEAGVTADVLVFEVSEDVEVATSAPYTYDRDMLFAVHGRFKGSADTLETRAWAFQTDVEEALEADPTLGVGVLSLALDSAETQADGSGEVPFLIRALNYRIRVMTRAGNPETAI